MALTSWRGTSDAGLLAELPGRVDVREDAFGRGRSVTGGLSPAQGVPLTWADVIGEKAAVTRRLGRRISLGCVVATLLIGGPIFWLGADANSGLWMGVGGCTMLVLSIGGQVLAFFVLMRSVRQSADYMGLQGKARKYIPFDSPGLTAQWARMTDDPKWPKVRPR